MTIAYPDVSNFQGAMPLQAATVAVCAKASESTDYADPFYKHFRSEANRVGAVFFAYHYLHLGNAAAQAQWCHSLVGPGVNVMIDHEPTGSVTPTLADAVAFARQIRALGNPCTLVYLPRWVWSQMGSPSLAALAQNGLSLASSDYTGYSDTGPGWAPYGGLQPAVWQWTDALAYSGQAVDFNAYRGTVAQLRALLGYTAPPTPTPVPSVEEQDMITFSIGKGPNGEEPGIWALSGSAYWHVPDVPDQGALLAAGVKQVSVDYTFHEAVLAATTKATVTVDAAALGAAIAADIKFPSTVTLTGTETGKLS